MPIHMDERRKKAIERYKEYVRRNFRRMILSAYKKLLHETHAPVGTLGKMKLILEWAGYSEEAAIIQEYIHEMNRMIDRIDKIVERVTG